MFCPNILNYFLVEQNDLHRKNKLLNSLVIPHDLHGEMLFLGLYFAPSYLRLL